MTRLKRQLQEIGNTLVGLCALTLLRQEGWPLEKLQERLPEDMHSLLTMVDSALRAVQAEERNRDGGTLHTAEVGRRAERQKCKIM